jgi:hypothetical protein
MKLLGALSGTALLACTVVLPMSASALNGNVLLRCLEDYSGLPPTLRAASCNCVADRASSVLGRLKARLSMGVEAELAAVNECVLATVDAIAARRQ